MIQIKQTKIRTNLPIISFLARRREDDPGDEIADWQLCSALP